MRNMGQKRALALVFVVLILFSASVSAKLVSPYGDKNITVIEMDIRQTNTTEYNITVTLYEIAQLMGSGETPQVDEIHGKIVAPATMAIPLSGKNIELSIGGVSNTLPTDEKGQVFYTIDASKITPNQDGCFEVQSKFDGDSNHTRSESRKKICISKQLILVGPLDKTMEEIKKNEGMQNTCLLFFVIIGFLVAGLYASGKDPLRLLDITTPRLPGARKKPEIRISVSEDKTRTMRKQHMQMEQELERAIRDSVAAIAKNAYSVRNAENDSERKRNYEEIYNSVMANIEDQKVEAKRRLAEEVRGQSLLRGVQIDYTITYNMYARIAEELVKAANNYITDKDNNIRRQIKDTWGFKGSGINRKPGSGLMLIDKYTSMRLIADQASLVDRMATGSGGTISDIRRKAEATTGVGYAVKVADNLRGWVKMTVDTPLRWVGTAKAYKEYYRAEKTYLKRREAIENEIIESGNIEASPEEIEKTTEEYKEYERTRAAWAREKEKGKQMPDIIKPPQEWVIATTSLSKEVIHDINNRLLKEYYEVKLRKAKGDKEKIKKLDEEMDKWRGELAGETRDVVERHEKIHERFIEKGMEGIYDNVMSEELYVEVITYSEENGYSKDDKRSGRYTLEYIMNEAEKNLTCVENENSAEFIIGASRAIERDPYKFDAIVETHEQQLRRYIELDDFVRSDVLAEARKNGMNAAIRKLLRTEKIENPEAIRETHARYFSDDELRTKPERYRARVENITQEELRFLGYSEAFRAFIERMSEKYGIRKEELEQKMGDLDNVRRHYARKMSELDESRERKIGISEMSEDEYQNRAGKIRERTANSVASILESVLSEEDIEILRNTEKVSLTPEKLYEISKDPARVESAIVEWAATSALNRATGITKRTGLKESIGDLANGAEWELTALKTTIQHAREFNSDTDKFNALRALNERLHLVEKPPDNAEDLLLAMDKRWKEVMFPSLIEFFKSIKEREGPAYYDLYIEETINRKKHIFIKGVDIPVVEKDGKIDYSRMSKEETQILITIVNKELPQFRGELAKIIESNAGVDVNTARGYISFYDDLSAYSIMHPGVYLPYDALAKYPWIVESKGEYLACPKHMPPYETMGSADTLVNAGIAIDEKGERVVLPIQERRVREVSDWLSRQANAFIQGPYIGVMAEARNTTILFTRHGGYLKKGVLGAFKGDTDFTKDVTRNEELASKLVEAYKLQYILSRRKEIKEEEYEKIINDAVNPEKIVADVKNAVNGIIDRMENEELREIIGVLREKSAREGVSEGDKSLYEEWIRSIENVRRGRNERGPLTIDEKRRIVHGVIGGIEKILEGSKIEDYDDFARVNSILNEYIKTISTSQEIKDITVSKSDAISDTQESFDRISKLIRVCRARVGEYVMQENLIELLAKPDLRIEENNSELMFTRKEIQGLKKIADLVVEQIKNEIKEIQLPTDDKERMIRELDNARKQGVEKIEAAIENLSKELRERQEEYLRIEEISGRISERRMDALEVFDKSKDVSEGIESVLALLERTTGKIPAGVEQNIRKAKSREELEKIFEQVENDRNGARRIAEVLVQKRVALNAEYMPKMKDVRARYQAMMKREKKLEAEILVDEQLKPRDVERAKFKGILATEVGAFSWELAVKTWKLGVNKVKNILRKIKGSEESTENIVPVSLVEVINSYSRELKRKGEERTEFEKLMIAHLRNASYISEKFLTRAFALYQSFAAQAHTRNKMYGLDFSGQAGYQFAGPLPSTLMQQLTTYGKYGNSGWFASLFLAHPIRKVHKMYSRRYSVVRMMSGVPAVYEPMKSKGVTLGLSMHAIKAFMYSTFKDKIAKMGEVIRTTAKDRAPPVFAPYLLTRNPYGELRINEMFELFSEDFRSTARGPRDCLNYLLYRPNDIVEDFYDILYTMKESRSMKKTPEHLMDVGIYGVVANSGFIAGREINFIKTELGGPESMYPNRGWGTLHYNPQLTTPTIRYSSYADYYKRTMKPSEVAAEMVMMTSYAEELRWQPLIPPAALFFLPMLSTPALLAMFGAGAAYRYRNYLKYGAISAGRYIRNPPWKRDDTWRTYEKFSERLRNMYLGMYSTQQQVD